MQSPISETYFVNIHDKLSSGLTASAFYVLFDWHSGGAL